MVGRDPIPGAHPPRHRAVVLGASNGRIGISVAIGAACRALGQPLDFMAAIGHGRSYGVESHVLGRSLEGILDCGLWRGLEQRLHVPTTALVTDIGNDILYGVSVEQIARWVEVSLQRLGAYTDRLIVTELPIEGIEKLTTAKYLAMRTLLFPRCRLDLKTTVHRALRLNELVLEIAQRRRARVVHLCPQWYGFDPIHVRKKFRTEFWEKIFRGQPENFWGPMVPLNWFERRYLRSLRPMQRRLFGVLQRTPQPAGKLRDETIVSLY